MERSGRPRTGQGKRILERDAEVERGSITGVMNERESGQNHFNNKNVIKRVWRREGKKKRDERKMRREREDQPGGEERGREGGRKKEEREREKRRGR